MERCPLCGVEAKKLLTTGDWSRYDCPNDKLFDMTDTAEAEIRNNPGLAKSHRDRLARERGRDIKIPKVGIFSSTHK